MHFKVKTFDNKIKYFRNINKCFSHYITKEICTKKGTPNKAEYLLIIWKNLLSSN
ncbi:hypothetical protein HMPREF9144_2308 [Prevotella pallens ATCC 700821]|uniref:Uncharacterized protein n=1 Tax=Prevotella pallens ATCC 700821 TaxID=997353 RepID=F9DKW6_9BACT|nr:hypothetical protein HMPREF9144_2308 [Prevotella pallens ATCC 700821]